MKHPDITPAQIVAAVGSIVGVLLSATVIDGHTAKLITGLVAVVVPLAFLLADAIIRHGRSKVAAAQVSGGAAAASTTPQPPGTQAP